MSKYTVHFLNGQFYCGEYNSIKEFVIDYYYDIECHEQWCEDAVRDGDYTENELPTYEDSVDFIVDDIERGLVRDGKNFSWEGYDFICNEEV